MPLSAYDSLVIFAATQRYQKQAAGEAEPTKRAVQRLGLHQTLVKAFRDRYAEFTKNPQSRNYGEKNPMDSARLAVVLPNFIEHELSSDDRCHGPLNVGDLQLGIRSVRLTEITGWSSGDLDLMEVYAAQFEAHTPLEDVLNVVGQGCRKLEAVTAISSPSPFAWT